MNVFFITGKSLRCAFLLLLHRLVYVTTQDFFFSIPLIRSSRVQLIREILPEQGQNCLLCMMALHMSDEAMVNNFFSFLLNRHSISANEQEFEWSQKT